MHGPCYHVHVMMPDPAELKILMYPEPVLRDKSHPVDPADPHVQAIAARMIKIMFEAEGAGLAAPQVGLPWRLFVTMNPDIEDAGLAWINPTLTFAEATPLQEDVEGCLSLPGITVEVERPTHVRIDAHDISGKSVRSEDERLARVIQHEFDHLEGVLIIDKMSTMERIRNRKAIKLLKRSS
jgi:peptide deformylase